MDETKRFFIDKSQHFFKPLIGKYREKARACIHALYLRLNGPMADYAYHLSRDDVLEIFTKSLSQIPELDDEDLASEELIKSDDELVRSFLKSFSSYGWIEQYQDDVGMRTAFRFTPKGRVFAKSFVDLGRDRIHSNNRNTRNTRSALQLYLEKADPYDLIEADRFAQEVFNDFNESIEEVELMQQLQAQEISNEIKLEQVTDDFFIYLEKKFVPNVSKMLGEESVKRYQAEIKNTIESLHNLSDAEKAKRELDLRNEFPVYRDIAGNSIFLWLLTQIEHRINSACEIKLPELRRVLDSFTRRTQLVIKQLTRIYTSQQQDVDRICRRLANLGEDAANQILTKSSYQLPLGKVKLVNPKHIMLPVKKNKSQVDTSVNDRVGQTLEEKKEAALRNALEVAFSIEDMSLINNILERLQDNKQIRSRHLDIKTVEDLFSAMHLASIGSIDHELDVNFLVEETDEIIANKFYEGKDFRVKIEPK